ncbi:MAG: agmatine deiminase family protein [Rhodothermales bacterium]|nr:agmatine deiminase family protein [Rhodothermales bacterium]MBO6778177.1 agmatine deiminase family protein [Rhodothermales bacterium]
MTESRFRMPAEWEPQQAVWVSWPHNRETWPGAFAWVEPAFAAIVDALSSGQTVHVNVLGGDHERHVRGLLRPSENVVFHHIPTNDAWCRDHGATLVYGTDGLVAIDFDYNAWGGKYPPFDLDAAVAGRMAEALGVPVHKAGLTLEGGAIDVNGSGVLLTTESCVLNRNRNPGLTRAEAEARLNALLGTETVLWVEGHIEGDDTDGHIDNLARFVSPRDIVMSVPGTNPDPAHAHLEQAFVSLREQAAEHGLRVHRLPLPAPTWHTTENGERYRLPASYANFLISNESVLIPAYGGSSDAQAAQILAPFFPDREVVLLDCRPLVWGLGAIHCLTQQVPA